MRRTPPFGGDAPACSCRAQGLDLSSTFRRRGRGSFMGQSALARCPAAAALLLLSSLSIDPPGRYPPDRFLLACFPFRATLAAAEAAVSRRRRRRHPRTIERAVVRGVQVGCPWVDRQVATVLRGMKWRLASFWLCRATHPPFHPLLICLLDTSAKSPFPLADTRPPPRGGGLPDCAALRRSVLLDGGWRASFLFRLTWCGYRCGYRFLGADTGADTDSSVRILVRIRFLGADTGADTIPYLSSSLLYRFTCGTVLVPGTRILPDIATTQHATHPPMPVTTCNYSTCRTDLTINPSPLPACLRREHPPLVALASPGAIPPALIIIVNNVVAVVVVDASGIKSGRGGFVAEATPSNSSTMRSVKSCGKISIDGNPGRKRNGMRREGAARIRHVEPSFKARAEPSRQGSTAASRRTMCRPATSLADLQHHARPRIRVKVDPEFKSWSKVDPEVKSWSTPRSKVKSWSTPRLKVKSRSTPRARSKVDPEVKGRRSTRGQGRRSTPR
jgi:hypothetical protein